MAAITRAALIALARFGIAAQAEEGARLMHAANAARKAIDGEMDTDQRAGSRKRQKAADAGRQVVVSAAPRKAWTKAQRATASARMRKYWRAKRREMKGGK